MNPVTETIKAFILKEFLPGQDPNELTDTTPLITSRILDSLATIKLVLFIEEQFHVTLQAHETDVDHMNTLADITNLIRSKKK